MPRDSHDDDLTAPTEATAGDDLADGRGTVGQDAAGQATAPEGSEPDSADEEASREPIREEIAVSSEHQVKVRRTPRYGRFMILGGVILAVASFIVTYSLPQGSGYDRNTVFGFVLLASIAVGVGLGALAAIIAAAATKHTERTVVADRIDVRQVEVEASGDELPAEAEGSEATDTKRSAP